MKHIRIHVYFFKEFKILKKIAEDETYKNTCIFFKEFNTKQKIAEDETYKNTCIFFKEFNTQQKLQKMKHIRIHVYFSKSLKY